MAKFSDFVHIYLYSKPVKLQKGFMYDTLDVLAARFNFLFRLFGDICYFILISILFIIGSGTADERLLQETRV